MKDNLITLYEFRKIVLAVEIGGLRSDAYYNAFSILEGAGEYGILNKYDSMPKYMQKKLRQVAREAVRGHKRGELYYIENNFECLYG